ncbi:hypothetical protein Bbelb_306970 [Branchiostoma belcheri]|nr:hypothetical protein Bbelb_306970 [Branchiostoma belcheri]
MKNTIEEFLDLLEGHKPRVENTEGDLTDTTNDIKQNRETRPYAQLHLAGDSALQDGDLEAAERHFASALKQVHDRESPRVKEEDECLRKLGDVYVRRGEQTKDGQDFAKATALYNAALARNGDKQPLIHSIKEAERLFLYHTVGIDCEPSPYETDIQHKDRLVEYRTEVKVRLDTIHKNHNPYQYDEDDPLVKEVEMKRAEAVRYLFKDISEQRKHFIKDLGDECIETIGPPPCQYAMVGLGSQATELVTPYSDLEFAILIEDGKDTPKNKEYFLHLTCYLYLKIINLGETILPAVAIKSLNDFRSDDPADSWFYDSVTPRGFAFDGAMPWASKTPLGREKTAKKPAVSLIQTPTGMAEFQRHDIALAHGYHLSSILRHVSYLTGDQTLVDDYMARVLYELWTLSEKGKTTVAVRFARASLNNTLKENCNQGLTDEPLDVKKQIYRFLAVAIMNLALLWNVYATSAWDTIKEMEEAGVITEENAHHLQVLVSISGELRLRTYLELGGQKENLSGLTAMQNKQDDVSGTFLNKVFHVPDQNMLFRYYCTALPLKRYVCMLVQIVRTAESDAGVRAFPLYYRNASSRVKAEICTKLLQFKSAISHIEEALRQFEEDGDAGTEDKFSLLGLRTECYRRLGDREKAINSLEEQRKLQQQYIHQLYGYQLSHVERAMSYFNLIEIFTELEDFKILATYSKEALAELGVKDEVAEHINYDHKKMWKLMTTSLIDTAHPDIAASLRNLGDNLCKHRDDHASALRRYEEALDMNKRVYGNDTPHPVTAKILNSLGFEWLHLGKFQKARSCFEQAFQMQKAIHGGDKARHPDIARALQNLGKTWCYIGDNAKALAFCQQALIMCEEHYGPKTPNVNTINSLVTLGDVWEESGDDFKGMSFYEKALKMSEEAFGEICDPGTAVLRRKLGSACRNAGEYQKSLSYYKRALEMNKAIHGQDAAHPDIANSLGDLAAVYDDIKDYTRAIQLNEEALNMLEVIHGGNETNGTDEACRSDIARLLNNRASTSRKAGQYKESLQYYEQVLEMNKAIHGEDATHPSIADTLSDLANAHRDLGNYTEGIKLYEEALKMLEIIHGGNETHGGDEVRHRDIDCVLNNLGVLCFFVGGLGSAYHKTGEHSKSLQYSEKALDMIKSLHGQDAAYPIIATCITLRKIAAVYEDLGEHTKVIQLYQDALDRVQTVQGENKTHPDILKLLSNLEKIYNKVGNQEMAGSYRDQARALQKATVGDETHREDTDSTGHKE